MIDSKFSVFIKEKLKLTWLIFFMLIMLLVGIIINSFEPFNFFEILDPILLLMMTSTIWVLKIVLKNISDLKKNYEKHEMFRQSFSFLFQPGNKILICFSFILMIFIYFICLYQLQFLSLNIMGCYTLFLGCGTFLLALIGYEVHLRLTICLKSFEMQCINSKPDYNINNPKNTPWLSDLYKLSKLLRISSLIIGILFVSENALFFIANMNHNSHFSRLSGDFKKLPLELWVIWIFIFATIVLALPIIALTQINSLRNIVVIIKKDFNNTIMNNNAGKVPYENLEHFFVSLQTTHIVEKSLSESYLLQRGEKFIAIFSTFLTCLIHILTFLDFLFA